MRADREHGHDHRRHGGDEYEHAHGGFFSRFFFISTATLTATRTEPLIAR